MKKVLPKQTLSEKDIGQFMAQLQTLLEKINVEETEENAKNLLYDFLKETHYKDEHEINTRGRTDLVIHEGKTGKTNVGVMMEVKQPVNKQEMVSKDNLNAKALQELLLYYLRERHDNGNHHVKHLIVTNIHEWFIFDDNEFDKLFYRDKQLIKRYEEWRRENKSTSFFYEHIAHPFIEKYQGRLPFIHLDLLNYRQQLNKEPKDVPQKLLDLYKLFSPAFLLKLPFTTDSNTLNKAFYHELLHILGLKEEKEKNKKLIQRKPASERQEGSLIENTIAILELEDALQKLPDPQAYGSTKDERLFNVALELCITWINRILFLKLLEGQLIKFHNEDERYRFLTISSVPDFDALYKLFFQVMAKQNSERIASIKEQFAHIPYLNSSLFEISELENQTIRINSLDDSLEMPLHEKTVLADPANKTRRRKGKMGTLSYLFAFLDAYDFTSEGGDEVQEERKSLINASVLGLIFEKINGYREGSFFTPGFVTMYMATTSVRNAAVEKFNEALGWQCRNFEEMVAYIDYVDPAFRQQANDILNDLKVCDPAVGSGHFLVSVLNEIIQLKSKLGLLQYRDGQRVRAYNVEVVNDELVVTDVETEQIFEYRLNQQGNPISEKQKLQEALFHEKQTIIENCLFGVDVNPNSVKICQLRLWIELLKNAYYTEASGYKELETLPNIDINIKQGNALVSRFSLDDDLSSALKSIKYSIDDYRHFVQEYREATDKETKRGFRELIDQIKGDFRTEIARQHPKRRKLQRLEEEHYQKYMGDKLFQDALTKQQQKDREKLEKQINKLHEELEAIRNNKIYLNAFEWRFEFPEVLDDEGNFTGFDVVIGNPPYIRQEELKPLKIYLANHYDVYTSTADILTYFIELGMNLLRDNGQFLHIVSNKFMRASYGHNLRTWLQQYQFQQIIDFGDLPVFEEATTYPCILWLRKQKPRRKFTAANIESLAFDQLNDMVRDTKFTSDQKKLNEQGWVLSSVEVQNLLQKLREQGTPLGEYVKGKIYRGVLTGYNEAFVIGRETKDRLIEEDAKSAEIIKPFLAGRDIKRYKPPKPDKWLIFTRRGIDIERYPAIKKHLEQYKEQLEPRPKDWKGDWPGRKPGSYEWYEIQDTIDYYEQFEQPKIIVPCIVKGASYTIDDKGTYSNDKTSIIASDGYNGAY